MENYKYGIIALLIAMIFVWCITPLILPILKKLNFGQAIREEGPKSHLKKTGTPTMGGLVIQAGIMVAFCLVSIFTGRWNFFCLAMVVAYGLIGFIDDYIKVSAKRNLGLRAWQKMALQFGFALLFAILAANDPRIGTRLYIPFIKYYVDFGIFYIPFTVFAIIGVTNAVNLTDGLDGLAAGSTGIVMIFFMIMAIVLDQVVSIVFTGAVIGACFGFLRRNSNPAEIFMGDVGSMALGGAVIGIAIVTRLQLYLLIAGLLFVIEALSVVIQVSYFKITHGKRVFLMVPIHHNFDLKGWHETRIVVVFWTLCIAFVALALLLI